MATRRPIYRKEKPRSVSKAGLLLCLLLAGGVMLVPVGGNVMHMGKVKLRDLTLRSGLIDFDDCVVTAEHAIACSSHAMGTPLPAALRQLEDSQAQAAEDREQRLKAESTVRELALEVERLKAQVKRAAQLAADSGGFFPPSGDVRPTGLTVTNPSTGDMMNTTGGAQPDQPGHVAPPLIVTLPSEED
jgi:hypothetical protein